MDQTVLAREPAWRTYLRSAAFVAPPLLAWAFISVFVFPKFQQMWRDSNMMDSEFQWMMGALNFAMHNTTFICGLLVFLFVALEFATDFWPRYRRAIVGLFVFILNTAVIVGLATACVTAAIAGPALVHR
jgi:hypothetical protein